MKDDEKTEEQTDKLKLSSAKSDILIDSSIKKIKLIFYLYWSNSILEHIYLHHSYLTWL